MNYSLLILCEGKPLVTSRFPSQRASNVELAIYIVSKFNTDINFATFKQCFSLIILCTLYKSNLNIDPYV